MRKIFFFAGCVLFVVTSCRYTTEKKKIKIDKVNRQRCSFELSSDLYLGKIDSAFDEESYFRILSDKSDNRTQLFVYSSGLDEDETLRIKVEALNSPDVFTARTIDTIRQFGNYRGKGVIMKGTWEGGIVKGQIKIFCCDKKDKGFVAVNQTVDIADTSSFKMFEESFRLK